MEGVMKAGKIFSAANTLNESFDLKICAPGNTGRPGGEGGGGPPLLTRLGVTPHPPPIGYRGQQVQGGPAVTKPTWGETRQFDGPTST